MADPTPFLSTLTATSGALVAIVGGLLVARFVSLDSEQQGALKSVEDARERLASAETRADAARERVLRWKAQDFLTQPRVLKAILDGENEIAPLRRLADPYMSEQELLPFVAEIVEEVRQATGYLTAAEIPDCDLSDIRRAWGAFRRTRTDLPEIVWPEVWSEVFEVVAAQQITERARERETQRLRAEAADPIAGSFRSLLAGLAVPPVAVALPSLRALGPAPGRSSDYAATNARRFDELVSARDRSEQQVEDLRDELRRLRQAHAEVVLPDNRLRWGLAVLVVFAVVGIGVPLWAMSQGPTEITPHIQWLFWGFAVSLALLLGFMLVYLIGLTNRRSSKSDTGASGEDPDRER